MHEAALIYPLDKDHSRKYKPKANGECRGGITPHKTLLLYNPWPQLLLAFQKQLWRSRGTAGTGQLQPGHF